MYRRPRHNDVLAILRHLDAELLASKGFLFAGGTRIVLELSEFRESRPGQTKRLGINAEEDRLYPLLTMESRHDLRSDDEQTVGP